jgi:cytochrome c biogenesis protein CcmG/thiol:disulfide interchange protein DsbE
LNTAERRSADDWTGQPALLNVWATWCFSCRVEHPYLLELAAQGVVIYGLNYKDEPEKAAQWLVDLGNPYTETIVDQRGDFGLDLGVYGAPETYVIDADGIIRHRHVGVVNAQVWTEQLQPFLRPINDPSAFFICSGESHDGDSLDERSRGYRDL